jgi:hypothetical protein
MKNGRFLGESMFEPTHATIIAPTHKRWKRIERKTVGLKITAAFVLLTFLTMLFHGNWFLVLLLIGLGVGFWQFNESWQRYCQRADVLEDVQLMTSAEFARYAAELLRAQGYSILSHGLSSHPQADLLLVRGKEYIACWLYNGRRTLGSGLVGRAAANVQPYDEWRAMVLSSQRLTVHAW